MLFLALAAVACGQSMDGYYTYTEVEALYEELADSDFVHEVVSIGKTRLGNDIKYIHIRDEDGAENRRGVLIVGGVAAEPMSVTGTL